MSNAVPSSARFAPLPETISSAPSKAELEILELWRREKTFEHRYYRGLAALKDVLGERHDVG